MPKDAAGRIWICSLTADMPTPPVPSSVHECCVCGREVWLSKAMPVQDGDLFRCMPCAEEIEPGVMKRAQILPETRTEVDLWLRRRALEQSQQFGRRYQHN
jgi:hypothetical protein